MNKVLKWFPLNKRINKGDTKSLLITLAEYVVVFFVLLIIRNILFSVKGIGNAIYNLFSVYRIYALIGLLLSLFQCFVGTKEAENEEIQYIQVSDISKIYKSNKKIIAWIVTVVVVGAMLLITPSSLQEKRIRKAARDFTPSVATTESEKKTDNDGKDASAAKTQEVDSSATVTDVGEAGNSDDAATSEVTSSEGTDVVETSVSDGLDAVSVKLSTDTIEELHHFDFALSSGKIIEFNSDGHFVLTGFTDLTSMSQMDTENSLSFADMTGDIVSEPVLTFHEPEYYDRVKSPYIEGDGWCWDNSTIYFAGEDFSVSLNMRNTTFDKLSNVHANDNQAAMDDMFQIDKKTLDEEGIRTYAAHIMEQLLPDFAVVNESSDNLTQKVNSMLPKYGDYSVKKDAKIYTMIRKIKRSEDGVFDVGEIDRIYYQNENGTEGGQYFFGTVNVMESNDVCGIKKDMSSIEGMYVLDGYRGLNPKACVFILPRYEDIDLSDYLPYESYDDVPGDMTARWFELMDQYSIRLFDTQYFVCKEDDIEKAIELFYTVFE